MNRLLFSLILLFITSPCYAQDYWVYIRTYDRPTVDSTQVSDGTYGRSKKGDIIQFLSVSDQFVPTKTEEESFAIIKVKDITKKQIQDCTEEWMDGNKKKMDRRRKIDIDTLNIKQGIDNIARDFSVFESHITEKSQLDIARARRGYYIYAYLQKPFMKIANKFIPRAFAAETVSNVNGGAPEHYNTLTLWETDKDGDLAGDTRNETASCYDDDGDLSDSFDVDDSTTDSDYYMKITVPAADRHDGTETTGFTINGEAWDDTINVKDNFTVVEWVMIDNSVANSKTAVILNATNCIIRYSIIRDVVTAGYDGISAVISSCSILDCIVYNINDDGIKMGADFQNPTAYNCTVYNCGGDGFINGGANSTATVRNCIAMANAGSDYNVNGGAWNGASNKNIDDDGTAPGGTTYTSSGAEEFESVAGGAEDFHINGGGTCDALNAGDDLGTGNGVNIDIDNRDRDAEGDTWDIGADEYAVGGGGGGGEVQIIVITG